MKLFVSACGKYSHFFSVWQNQGEKPIPNGASPNHSQSPKICSRITDNETQGTATAKSLNEKLVLETVSDDSSTQHCQSPQPDVFTNVKDEDMQDSVKSLSEKLASALLTINAKDDLVKQHTKVAEEAVAGNLSFHYDFRHFALL